MYIINRKSSLKLASTKYDDLYHLFRPKKMGYSTSFNVFTLCSDHEVLLAITYPPIYKFILRIVLFVREHIL